ncbi:MAG: hypothetical protein DRP45_07415 [Candidatus Zixiibacteriota bacterium]|nr:MAG: hypothetical protein DRP45_07415 [candidate division Zixibacteria bacterium]
MSPRITLLLVAVLLVTSVADSTAQDFDDRSATARVMTVLSVTATQDLNFGKIFGGVPKVMGNDDDDSSAVFSITGEASAGISVQLTLPEYLSLADGSANMTIVFNNSCCSIDTIGTATPSTVVGGFVDIDPRTSPSGVIVGSGGAANLFLGGKVLPSANQKAGAYSGDIVLSVSYNGT